jgi:hypothetical protein
LSWKDRRTATTLLSAALERMITGASPKEH